ncbi:T-cell immunomodulatory protein-like [Physella acuta]|uniref:T-cell immunomodulatory protein-like n=1 Tax=Physella acuta TaxID=109671 RepID=UPI0027DE8064|nr:T-cell immunomodulatory protein-like [Physella acuta]XP_059168867.1 T-cell immunomodulatory protein-like [Physella acuta]
MISSTNSTVVLVLLIILVMQTVVYGSLSDVTTEVFDKQPLGIISAFGDLDANKATDFFVLSPDGKSVYVLEADIDIRRDGTKFNNRPFINGNKNDLVITSIVPGDFNRDSQLDVLIMRTSEVGGTAVTVEIHDGKDTSGQPFLKINETFRDQPVVIDGDGDMVPDLFGETVDGKRALWTFKDNKTYSVFYYQENNTTYLPPLKIPQASAFLDLNGDLFADLCVVSEVNKVVSFEFWLNEMGNLTYTESVQAPDDLKVVGQASFVDLNGNHEINIVLPGCLDEQCTQSVVYVWSHNKTSNKATEGSWFKLDVNFKVDNDRVTSFSTTNPFPWLSLPIALRFGDFNLDGFPDAVAVMSDSKNQNNKSAFIIYNEECRTSCEHFSRSLSIDYKHPLEKYNPVVVAFYDLLENGVLDILLTEIKDGTLVIRAIEQDFTGDASFLKVLVVSGLCQDNCPNGHSPYGVNQVGPTAKFVSTTPTGDDQIGVASQLCQSAYFSLQLPFILFGLGQTPNFVDDLQIGIPYPPNKSPRKHSWSTIIPNSQVIVLPYPVDNPNSWKHELYVTPSRLVLLTGASLLGTCAFIAAIVGLLQWRERIEDKKEKLQEAQRFHFDAM